MDRKTKVLTISIVGFIIIFSTVSTFLIINFYSRKTQDINLEFTPKEMKSYPNHTAWLLLDIRTKTNDLMANLSLLINTNISIEMKYQIWENSPLNKVVEVFLYPNITHLDKLIEIEAIISSEGISKRDHAVVKVINWTIEITPLIEAMRDEFVNYLSNNHSEFKINGSTVWEGFGNTPQRLVVEHYLFKSAFWEMELARHVMISPYDWVEIYLRPRSSLSPNWSGKINSWSNGTYIVIEEEPPDEILR